MVFNKFDVKTEEILTNPDANVSGTSAKMSHSRRVDFECCA
jgi:hypothetical protein